MKNIKSMNKTARILALTLALIALFAGAAAAASNRFFDDGAGLSEAQCDELNSRLDALSERVGVDVVIYSDVDLKGENAKAMFNAIADSGEYLRRDNEVQILCLVVGFAGNRQMWIGYEGDGTRAVGDKWREVIFDLMTPDMKSGNYYAAYSKFIDAADEYLTYFREHGEAKKKPFPVVSSLITALVLGFLIAKIKVSSLRAELKSVAMQKSAANYQRPGSLALQMSSDTFLFRNVTRTAKPKKSSSSSSGSRGGGGRSF